MTKEEQRLLNIIEELEDVEMKKSHLQLHVEAVAEWLEKKELTKAEREKLKDICCIMQQDASDTLDKCQAIGALVISILAVFISAISLTLSMWSGSGMAVPVAICSNIFIVLPVLMVLYTFHKINKNAKLADKYRNICLALIMLSDE